MDRFGLYPAPEGLPDSVAGVVPAQCAALGAVLSCFEGRMQEIAGNAHMTDEGKRTRIAAEQRGALGAIDEIERRTFAGGHSIQSLQSDSARSVTAWRGKAYRRPEGVTDAEIVEARAHLNSMEPSKVWALAETAAKRREPGDMLTLFLVRSAPAVRPLLDQDAHQRLDQIQQEAEYPGWGEAQKLGDLHIQRVTDNLWKARATIKGEGRIQLPGARGGRIVW